MADFKWIKIATDIFDDEKILLIESLPDHYAIITAWFKLLCLAGKQNNCGVFMISDKIAYTDEMFATIFRMPVNTVRLALETFSNFGMIEIVNDVVTIPNWEKHQSLDKIERYNEHKKNYMREYRKKQAEIACNGNSNGNVTAVDKNRREENREEENIYSSLASEVKGALDSFMAMRKKLKKPMSELAIKRLITKLQNLSNDPSLQVKILNQSEDHCWLDVYPLKTEEKSTAKNFTQRPSDYYKVEQFYE